MPRKVQQTSGASKCFRPTPPAVASQACEHTRIKWQHHDGAECFPGLTSSIRSCRALPPRTRLMDMVVSMSHTSLTGDSMEPPGSRVLDTCREGSCREAMAGCLQARVTNAV